MELDHHHHEPKVFHHDRFGYVAHCSCCQAFQVGFGNVFITQSRADLFIFSELINRYYHKYKDRDKPYTKNIHMDSPCQGFGLLFSPIDLERLNHMLQKTMLILKASDPIRHQ